MTTNSSESTYDGRANLEAMKHAKRYNAFLLDLIRSNSVGAQILDFGAGAGTFALPMSNGDAGVICVEPDALLRAELERSSLKVASSLKEIAPNSVDYVYSLNVLEHIKDDRQTIRDLYQCLKQIGRASCRESV